MNPATLAFEAASERTWDAVVLGAGPAGALAARLIAAGGAGVLLVEKKTWPRSKVCGACLNGQALAVLRSVGLGSLVDRQGGIDLERFQVRLGGRELRFPIAEGKALSRERFDAALVESAIAAGAHFLPETQARVEDAEALTRRVRLDQHGRTATTEARVVLVAAGIGNSCLEHVPAARTRTAVDSRLGARCVVDEFPDAYQEKTIFMAVGKSGYVGLVRIEDGQLNVAAAFDKAFLKSNTAPGCAAAAVLAEAGFPPIAALHDAAWLGTVGLTRQTRPIGGERLFVLGDASGYVEPFTGEGIGWALVSGQAIAPLALRGIERWQPSLVRDWSRLHHRLVDGRQHVCRGLAQTLRRPWVARAVFDLVTRVPAVSQLVLHHLNEQPVLNEVS